MNVILREDQVLLNKVVEAYCDEVKTMSYHCPPFLYGEIGFVPSLYDITGRIFGDQQFEAMVFPIIRCCQKHYIFLKFYDDFINFPTGEVW